MKFGALQSACTYLELYGLLSLLFFQIQRVNCSYQGIDVSMVCQSVATGCTVLTAFCLNCKDEACAKSQEQDITSQKQCHVLQKEETKS